MSENIYGDAGDAEFPDSDTRFSGISGNGANRSSARLWFPPRRQLHLVDIENLASDPRPTLDRVREVRGLYAERVDLGDMDQFEVAASGSQTLKNAAFGWPRVRYSVRHGPDGAERALLDVLGHEDIAGRFRHVVFGSGDGLFADAAARLAAQGVWVTVVSWRGSLSPRLKLAAHEVIYLDADADADAA